MSETAMMYTTRNSNNPSSVTSSAGGKHAQILELTPQNELRFDGPFDNVVTSFLQLYNPTNNRVCFKVKTTAPRRYCVRPNSGIVEPSSKVSIAIMLQPFEIDSQLDRNKHKFMVQSAIVKDEEGDVNQDALWKSISNDQIMDSKLKCVFHIPNTTTTTTSPLAAVASSITSSAVPSLTTLLTSKQQQQQQASTDSSSSASQQSTTVSSTAASNTTTQNPLANNRGANNNETTSFVPSSFGNKQQISTASSVSTTTNTITPGDSTSAYSGQYASNLSTTPSKAVSSQANLSSGSLNTSSLQSFEEQKATILIAAFVILILGIILGKYII